MKPLEPADKPRRGTPLGRVNADDLNAAFVELVRQGRFFVEGGEIDSTSTGLRISIPSPPEEILIQILAADRYLYSWREMRPVLLGNPEVVTGGRSGTYIKNWARDVNYTEGMSPGTLIYARRGGSQIVAGEVWTEYLFNFENALTPSDPATGGTDFWAEIGAPDPDRPWRYNWRQLYPICDTFETGPLTGTYCSGAGREVNFVQGIELGTVVRMSPGEFCPVTCSSSLSSDSSSSSQGSAREMLFAHCCTPGSSSHSSHSSFSSHSSSSSSSHPSSSSSHSSSSLQPCACPDPDCGSYIVDTAVGGQQCCKECGCGCVCVPVAISYRIVGPATPGPDPAACSESGILVNLGCGLGPEHSAWTGTGGLGSPYIGFRYHFDLSVWCNPGQGWVWLLECIEGGSVTGPIAFDDQTCGALVMEDFCPVCGICCGCPVGPYTPYPHCALYIDWNRCCEPS